MRTSRGGSSAWSARPEGPGASRDPGAPGGPGPFPGHVTALAGLTRVEPFRRLTAVAAPLDLPNVDTDRIIPARFLRQPRSVGYGQFLFHDLRVRPDGREDPGFVLNRPPYRAARILAAAENFGCGSSREGAVWALAGYGIRAVVAPSFGDIFAENCLKNGLLPVVLPAGVVAALIRRLEAAPGATVTVDLAAQTVRGPDGLAHRFEIDPFRKEALLGGLDEIALTDRYREALTAFEARHVAEWPWAVPVPLDPSPHDPSPARPA
jgi:3-isopropylmalate/(R)-2-methylmalate dehydratase small subunit